MYIYNAGHSLEINPSQVTSQASIFTTAIYTWYTMIITVITIIISNLPWPLKWHIN